MKYQWLTKLLSAFFIVTLMLAAVPVTPAYAAVANLNQWPATPTQTATTGNPAAANFTANAGTDRLLVVVVDCYDSAGANGQTFSVTYGGAPLTQAVLQNNNRRQTWIGWRALGTSVTNTTQSLAVTVTGTHTNVAVWAAVYSDVNQTTPLTDTDSIYSDNTTAAPQFPNVTAVNAGGWAIYTWSSSQTRTSDNGGYTEHGEATAGVSTGVASRAFATAGTTQPTVTFAGTVRTSMSLVTLNPSVLTTTTGVATAAVASSSTINVSMPYTGDSNANNTYTVEYKLSIDSTWTTWMLNAPHSASPYNTVITGLNPASSYDVRVTYNDSDGVTGTNPQVIGNISTACNGDPAYTAPAGTDRVVVVVASAEGVDPSAVQIGGVAATTISLAQNTDARIYVGYRVIGTSAVPQAMNINTTGATCVFARTYNNVSQVPGTGAGNTINSIATGTAGSGTTTTSNNVFNAAGGAVNNQAGGRVIYAINMNQGDADGQVGTGTSTAWTFTEIMDKYDSNGGNRTGAGESTTTAAGSATVSVGYVTNNHNRSVLVAFALNPVPVPAPPLFTSANATTFTVGTTNTFNVTASGFPAPTFAVTAGTLPSGVTLSTAGVLAGTPAAGTTVPGTYPITITATNANGTDTQNFTLTVQKANTTLAITSDLPDPSITGADVTVNFSITSAGNTITPTGNITVSDGVNSCTGTVTGAASPFTGSCVITLTTSGARTLTASYPGNDNFNAPTNATTGHQVNAGFIITASAGAGGSITPSGKVGVASGGSQAFASTPTGTYILSDVLVDGSSVTAFNNYTINNVTTNRTIVANFDGGWTAPTPWGAPVPAPVNTCGEAYANGYASDNSYVTCNNGQTIQYGNFNFNIPLNSIIDGVEVAIEGNTDGRNLNVSISENGGNQFGSFVTTNFPVQPGAPDATLVVGRRPGDNWGISFTPASFSNLNFRLQVTGTGGGSIFSLDQIQVKVYYREPTTLTVNAASGTYGGTTNLTATLTTTTGGNPVGGQTITFYLNGFNVGTATTNGSGVATLNNIDLKSGVSTWINAGSYPGTFNTSGVGASYAGTAVGALPGYRGSNAAAALTVNKAALTVTANDKSREYGLANPVLDATITGFVNGETLATSDVTGSPSCTTTAVLSSPVLGSPYPITCTTGTLASTNYDFTFAAGALTVTMADLNITASSHALNYGDPVPAITPSYTGLRAGDTGPATAPTCTTTATSSSPVGSYPTTCSGAADPNYNISYTPGSITVGTATLTVTANDKSREYGLANPVLDATITGFVNGETLATSDVTGSPSCTTTAVLSSPVTGSPYPIICTTGTLASTNYDFTFVNGNLSIAQAAVDVTASSETMTYGGTVPAITPSYTGLRAGDTAPATAPTCTTTATTSSPVGPYPSTCSGAADPNYTFTYTPGTVAVTQAALTVTANDKSRAYGVANPAFDATITGFVNGETLGTSDVTGNPVCTTTATPSSPVSGSPYAITCVIGTLSSSNYAFNTFAPGDLTITQSTLTVTANDKTREYGLANPVLDAALTGFVNGETLATSDVTGDPVCTTTAVLSSPVTGSPYPITCTIGTLASTNYDFTFAAGELTITQADLNITASSHALNYGDPVPAITPSYMGLRAGDTAPATAPTCSTTATSSSPVGPYPTTCTGAADPNYNISYTAGSVVISANTLLITASDDTMVYGGTVPVITPAYTGLQAGDTGPATPPVCVTTATNTSPVGPYASSCSGAADPNYTISYAAGTVTVTRAALNITASSATMTYGDPVPAITPNYTGFVAGDNAASLTTAPTCSTTATSTSAVGSYPSSCTGAASGNYTIGYTPGSVTIDPLAITVTAVADTKAYDSTISSAGVPLITGTLVGTDTPNFSQTFDTPAIGTGKTLTPGGTVNDGNSGNNYTVTFVPNPNGAIVGIAVTVDGITASNKVYNGNTVAVLNTVGASLSGVIPGDDVQLDASGATGAFANKNVGNGKTVTVSGLVLTGADAANYGILPYTTTANITTRPITVTAQTNTKDYDSTTSSAAVPAISGSGLAAGDSANFTQTYNNANAGTSKTLTPSGAVVDGNGGGNYLVTFVNDTTGVINRLPIEITANPQTKAFGDLDPALTYSMTGGSLVGGDSLSGNLTRAPGESVGTYAISQGSLTAGSNYDLTFIGANFTIVNVNQTITVITPAPANSAYNSSFNVAATASSGLPVAITTTGVCTGSGSTTATILMISGTGSCVIHYNQAGNLNFNPAIEVIETIVAQKADQTISVNTSAPASAVYNSGFNVSATASSGLSVAYSSTGVCTNAGSNFTMTSGTGTCTVQYNQVGNANYNAAPQVTQTVNAQKAAQTISVTTSAPAGAAFNSTFTVAATASSGLPVAYTSSGSCTNAGATYTMTSSTGTCSALYNQAGNANYTAAPQVTQTVNAQKANQTITVTTPAPASAAFNSTFTVAATASSGLTVTYSASGSCTNAGATFTITSSIGNCTVHYNQAGNGSYNAAPEVTETVNAATTNQTITVTTPAPANAALNSTFTVAATASSGLPVTYSSAGSCTNTGATFTMTSSIGTCTVQYNQAGNANYNPAPQVTQSVNAQKANQTITVTTPPPGSAAFNSTFTVAATASSGLPVVYSATGSCSNAGATFNMTSSTGTCVVHFNQAGDADYNAAPEVTDNVAAGVGSQTITVTTHAPATAAFNTSFTVAATASSGEPVDYSASGSCTNVGAVFTITINTGTCTVHYNQAGNASYNAAPEITEASTVFIDGTAPTVTINQAGSQSDPANASPINFTAVFSESVTGFDSSDVVIGGSANATTAAVTGSGTTYTVAVSGMANDGTVTVSVSAGAATDSAGNPSLASTSTDNSVTYFDAAGPTVSAVSTSAGGLADGDVVRTGVNQFSVKFSQDVFNPSGDSDTDDVTNPNNFILVRELGDTAGFQTVNCSSGAVTPADTKITIGTISYDAAIYTATFTVNNSLALSNGKYRLFVCGTTSIVDPLNNALALVGSSGPNTDFIRTFDINIAGGGGGGGNGNGNGGGRTTTAATTAGSLIPVTGFAPGMVTKLPEQPAELAYKDMSEMRLEIPSLSLNIPIVGVKMAKNGWDLTWLGNNAGYLEGSAYPTWAGNTVLTGHVLDERNAPGAFAYIKELKSGDLMFLHAYGSTYVYQVEESMLVRPHKVNDVFKHEEYNWLTLVTCENFSAKAESYLSRRVVRAVLISVQDQ